MFFLLEQASPKPECRTAINQWTLVGAFLPYLLHTSYKLSLCCYLLKGFISFF